MVSPQPPALPPNLLQASTFSPTWGTQLQTLFWSLLWGRALALVLGVVWSRTGSVGCRRQGYCTGSFILHSLKRLWSPEYMPYTQEMAWQGRTKSLALRFIHQREQLRTQQHPVTSGVRPGELGPLQVCLVSTATQEGCGKFVQVKAWTAGRAARLSPSPRMKCGRRMEGSGPRGPWSTAGDPKRWGVRRSGFGSQAALTH